jgi:HK97 family phage major capsid protein
MAKLSELRQRRADLADKLQKQVDDAAAFDVTRQEIEGLDGQIERAATAERLSATRAVPVNTEQDTQAADNVIYFPRRSARDTSWKFQDYLAHARKSSNFTPDPKKNFRSFGDQLVAIRKYAESRGSDQDPRLVRAPLGAGESDATAGGFLVQTDFATSVWALSHDMGEILQRVNSIPIGAQFNGIKIPAVNETSRANGSRWGGVTSNWVGEGTAGTPSRPAFRLIELSLGKLISIMYASDELLADSTAFSSIASQAFSEEIVFNTEDAIFEGDGVGKPLGILNSPALVSVAKDNGQAAATLTENNIQQMWSRMHPRSRKNAVWHINQDVEPQLYQLSRTIGTGGVPVYMPPGGLSAEPFGVLYGRPVIPLEYSASIGAVGDITFVDWSQYLLADKNGVQAAQSMHIQFLTDQQAFRLIYRVDGKPGWHTALTPFKGSATKSPYIALAART